VERSSGAWPGGGRGQAKRGAPLSRATTSDSCKIGADGRFSGGGGAAAAGEGEGRSAAALHLTPCSHARDERPKDAALSR
jgi:hypothetical protein